MKKLLLLVLSILMMSCTAEPLVQEELINQPPIHVNKEHVFKVVWSSNQGSPYVEFNKHVFQDCEVKSTITEVHRENEFNVTLKENQLFDIHIKREESVKNPELYLSIYKDGELQYEKEVNTNGYVLMTYVDKDGNLPNQKENEY